VSRTFFDHLQYAIQYTSCGPEWFVLALLYLR
jgi:hypothetical protein